MNWLKAFWNKLNAPPGPLTQSATSEAAQTRAAMRARVVTQSRAADPEEALSNVTPRAQKVLALARDEARRLNHNFVGTEHLLLGLVRLEQGTAVNALRKMGVDLESVRAEVVKAVGAGPDQKMIGNIPYTPRVKKVIALGAKEAKALNHSYLGTEHLLLGMLREADGVAGRVLQNLGVHLDEARNEILAELDPKVVSSTGKFEDAPPITVQKKPMLTPIRQPLDTTLRYDVYCLERNLKMVVYRNVLMKSIKTLFQRNDHDPLADFIELEQADGKVFYVAKTAVVRLCQPGVNPDVTEISG